MVGLRRRIFWDNGGYPREFPLSTLHTHTNNNSAIEACTVNEWLARKDPYRVTAKRLPVQGRLMTRASDEPRLKFYTRWAEPYVEGILAHHKISYADYRFEFQYLPHEEEDGQDVLVVDSPDTETRSWPAAARDLLNLFRIYRSRKTACGVEVEIRNPDKMYNDISIEVPPDDALMKELKRVETKVKEIAEILMNDVALSAAFHSRVRFGSPRGTPGKVTLMVFCRPGQTFDYRMAEEEMIHALRNTKLDIHVEFLPYRIKAHSDSAANDSGSTRQN